MSALRKGFDGVIELRRLSAAFERPLMEMLRALERAGDTAHFQPHPFTPEQVGLLAKGTGDDLYYVIAEGDRVLAYGMLRGWDEGYAVPSLGIAVHPAARGSGLGKLMMSFLHAAARRRGSSVVRLRVAVENRTATRLYESLGYRFTQEEGGYRVGFLELPGDSAGKV